MAMPSPPNDPHAHRVVRLKLPDNVTVLADVYEGEFLTAAPLTTKSLPIAFNPTDLDDTVAPFYKTDMDDVLITYGNITFNLMPVGTPSPLPMAPYPDDLTDEQISQLKWFLGTDAFGIQHYVLALDTAQALALYNETWVQPAISMVDGPVW